jgi:hypothetical protein
MLLLYIIVFVSILALSIYYFQNQLIFFPSHLPAKYQYRFPFDFEEINFDVDSKTQINALHFHAENPKGIVFYSHGNAGDLSGWGYVAETFLENNYDVLIYDYRSYGKSTGKISESNLYHDASYIYRELLKDYDQKDIVVYGRSIGTAIAAHVAALNNPRSLILESPYYNFRDLVRNYMPFLPAALLRYELRNDLLLEKIDCPVYIFHGTKDEVINYKSSVKLQKHLKEGDELILVPGGHHNDLSNYKKYQQELSRVLRQ